jgi:UDP-glucose 4-epimerase
LADYLLEKGYRVKGIDNLFGGYADNVPAGVEFLNADLMDLKTISEFMKGVDLVYHCACTAHEGLSVFSPHLITMNTFQITASAASAAIANGVKRFVFCSSMARYGTQEKTPFTEDMVPNPQDPYAIAKLAAEKLLMELGNTHGMEIVIAVPHNIIGPRQKYDDPYRNVASIMMNLMLQGRAPIIYGDGLQERCFSNVGDVVQPLYKMGFTDGLHGEVINIGPDEGVITINGLGKLIAEILDYKGEFISMPERPREVKIAHCSADKARRLLDYKTTIGIKESLEGIRDYIVKRGVKPFEYKIELEIVNEKTPKTWSQRLF